MAKAIVFCLEGSACFKHQMWCERKTRIQTTQDIKKYHIFTCILYYLFFSDWSKTLTIWSQTHVLLVYVYLRLAKLKSVQLLTGCSRDQGWAWKKHRIWQQTPSVFTWHARLGKTLSLTHKPHFSVERGISFGCIVWLWLEDFRSRCSLSGHISTFTTGLCPLR